MSNTIRKQPVKVNLAVTPLLVDGGERKASLSSAAPVPWSEAPVALRHDASFLLAERVAAAIGDLDAGDRHMLHIRGLVAIPAADYLSLPPPPPVPDAG